MALSTQRALQRAWTGGVFTRSPSLARASHARSWEKPREERFVTSRPVPTPPREIDTETSLINATLFSPTLGRPRGQRKQ